MARVLRSKCQAVLAAVALSLTHSQSAELDSPGHLNFSRLADGIQVSWTNGVLQATSQLATEWSDSTHVHNPLAVSTSGDSRYFRLRAAQPSTISGRLISRGHPIHSQDFTLALNGNPLVPTWSSISDFRVETGLPGSNRIELRHPWYLTAFTNVFVDEGSFSEAPDYYPEYRGRLFQFGSAACRLVGHAGGNSLVGVNNHASCSDGREKGLWFLEIDVCISGDGIPFLSHDWTAVKNATGLDYGATAEALVNSGRITLLSDVLADFDWIIADLTHNTHDDVVRIVDYLDQHYPGRVRRDVFMQVYQRPDYHYIKNLDPALKLSFNLASWSAWGITDDWKNLIADIVAATDFYVINPSTMITADMIAYLNGNGRTNILVPVMHTHSPAEIIRLHELAPGQVAPMIYTPDLIPESWPPGTNCLPAHPHFHFSFSGAEPLQNAGDAPEVNLLTSQEIARTSDETGNPDMAIQLRSTPPSDLQLTSDSLARINAGAALESTWTLSVKASRFNTPQVLAMGMQAGNPRYVIGFYLFEGNAYFIFTHPNNSQTWVLAGSLTDRRWHRLTATVGEGQITTYQDGLIVSAAIPAEPLAFLPISSLRIGHDPLNAARAFDGALDELALYPYALSQDEVWSLASNGSRFCPPFTLSAWPVAPNPDEPFTLTDTSRSGDLSMTLLPDTQWGANRDAEQASSLQTVPGQAMGAYLNTARIALLNDMLGSGWTLSGWVRPLQTAGTQFLWGGQNRNRAQRYHIGFSAYDGHVLFFVRPATGDQIVVNAGTLTTENWQHLAVTCDGLTLHTYLNGTAVAEISLPDALLLLDQLTDFSVGFDPVDANRTSDAFFDQITIHPFALSPEEVHEAALTPASPH